MSAAVGALVAALESALGTAGVSVDPEARRVASTDWSERISPILAAHLPAGLADIVAYPRTPHELAAAIRLAHKHRVPVTPRGQGTGTYGQAIPLRKGLVIDTSRSSRIHEIGDGWIKAEAGTSFVTIEAAARRCGQEIAIMPSTVGSTIGRFIAGGAGGIGSIENGWTWDQYVHAVDVAPCTDDGGLVEVTGADCRPLVHAYGVSGVIATATVALVPAHDWTAALASFPSEPTALEAGRQLMRLDPPPRLVSLDEPGLVALLPRDPAMPLGRFSLRAIIDASTLPAAATAITACGGLLGVVRPKGAAYLGSLSFNHTTYRARRARAELCHLQVGGDALVERTEEVRTVLPGTLLHFDGFRIQPTGDADPMAGRGFVGLLLCRFDGAEALYTGVERLRELGVQVEDPHTWLLRHNLDAIRKTTRRFDPDALLNPGKLPPA
jgi:FAD/FMN-containing dehydrogenase